MTSVTIYHNPRCSKSRQTLALLQDKGVAPSVIEYLKNPPSESELIKLIDKLRLSPLELIRQKDALFKSLSLEGKSDKVLIQAMATHPALIERPIVVKGEKAVLGRPPENIEVLF